MDDTCLEVTPTRHDMVEVALRSTNPVVVEALERLLVAVSLAHGDEVHAEAIKRQTDDETLDMLMLRL